MWYSIDYSVVNSESFAIVLCQQDFSVVYQPYTCDRYVYAELQKFTVIRRTWFPAGERYSNIVYCLNLQDTNQVSH